MLNDFETVKNTINIIDFFRSENLTLIPIGENNFRINPAPCCNHNDCFTIYGKTQSFNCYSCGTSGDIFDYYEKILNKSKSESLKILADKYCIQLNETYNNNKIKFDNIFNQAIEYYHNCLLTSKDKIEYASKNYTPLQYQIEIRKHSIEILKQHKIGWAGGGLIKHLTNNGFKIYDLKKLSGALFNNTHNKITDRYYKCFIYPYFINNNEIGNVNSKNPIKTKENKSFKFSGKFISAECLFYNQESIKNNTEILIVEGQNDVLSILDKADWRGGVIATGGCLTEKQIIKIQELATDKKIYLCFDNNQAGQNYTYKIFKKINHNVNNIFVCSFNNLYIDIDELLCKVKNQATEFNLMIENSKLIKDFFETPETIINQIDAIKNNNELSNDNKLQEVSKIIIDFLDKNGKFFYNLSELSFYYFYNAECLIYDIEKTLFSIFINKIFLVNKSTYNYKFLIEDLKKQCRYSGKDLTINKKPYFYNINTKQLYVFDFKKNIYRLNGRTIDKINNGGDDVYFLCSGDTFNILDNNEIPETADIDNLFFDYINFAPNEESALNESEQKLIFEKYFYSLFFPELLKDRPILVFIGAKGAGKSFGLNLIPMLLLGKSELTTIKSENDLNSILTNNYFCFIDNIDEFLGKNKSWLLDSIASAATGITIKLRKLYSNNENIEFQVNSWIGITSRTTAINRDDIADRSIIFQLKPIRELKTYFNKTQILEKIKSNRNKIFTLIFKELNRIINKLQSAETIESTNFRMSEWAAFVLSAAGNDILQINEKNILAKDYYNRLFEKMQKQQNNFAIDGDVFLEIITDYILAYNKIEGTTAYIYEQIKKYSYDNNFNEIENFNFLKSVNAFGMTLKHKMELLKSKFNIEKKNISGKKHISISYKS